MSFAQSRVKKGPNYKVGNCVSYDEPRLLISFGQGCATAMGTSAAAAAAVGAGLGIVGGTTLP